MLGPAVCKRAPVSTAARCGSIWPSCSGASASGSLRGSIGAAGLKVEKKSKTETHKWMTKAALYTEKGTWGHGGKCKFCEFLILTAKAKKKAKVSAVEFKDGPDYNMHYLVE